MSMIKHAQKKFKSDHKTCFKYTHHQKDIQYNKSFVSYFSLIKIKIGNLQCSMELYCPVIILNEFQYLTENLRTHDVSY